MAFLPVGTSGCETGMLTIYSKRNTIVNKGWFIISFSSNRPLSFKVTPSETDKRNTHLILNTNKNLKVNVIILDTSHGTTVLCGLSYHLQVLSQHWSLRDFLPAVFPFWTSLLELSKVNFNIINRRNLIDDSRLV